MSVKSNLKFRAIMHISNFIRLVEEEYDKVVVKSRDLMMSKTPHMLEKPEYICDQVQKFRSWLIMAMRTLDVWDDFGRITPEDAIVHAATSYSSNVPDKPMHPKMVSMISLFDRDDFMGIFNNGHRDRLENFTGSKITSCRFRECYPFCPNFFKDI